MHSSELLLGLMLLCSHTAVLGEWYSGSTKFPDTEWQKSKDSFGASLLLTPNSKEMYKSWNQKPSPTYKPNIYTTNSAKRGEMVSAAIFITGCKPNASGNCQVIADYVVINPDGTIYADIKNAEVWLNKPSLDKHTMQISINTLDFLIEKTDQVGLYMIKAMVKDNVNNTVLPLFQNLQVTSSNEQ